jgi:hypothetical protein
MFNRVELKPENVLYRIGRALGMHEIDFEVEEFNRKYFATATDRKFAFDLLSPKTIDLLLRFPTRHWQFDGSFIVLLSPRFYDYLDALRALEEVREVIESFDSVVRNQCGLNPTWQPLMGGGSFT